MIEIYAVTYNGQPAAATVRGVFGPEGGSIGRNAEHRLALPDPARHVSRLQAKVRHDGARFWISNASDANPLFLNDEEIESGRERPIVPGDELRVGLYVLRVRTPVGPVMDYRPAAASGAEQTLGAKTGAARIVPSGPPPAPVSIDGLLGAGSAAANPFADLLGGSVPLGAPAASTAAGVRDPLADLLATPQPAATPPRIDPIPTPPHRDPLAAPRAAHPPPTPAPTASAPTADPLGALAPASSADPFADLLGPSSSGPASPARRPATTPATHIPDDFNPFAMPAAPSRNTADPLADLAKNSIDLDALSGEKRPSLVDFDPSAKVDPRDVLRGGTPSLVDPLHAVDPMKLFGGADDRLVAPGAAIPAGGKPMRDDFAELGSNFTPPRALADPQAPVRGLTGAAPLDPMAQQSKMLADLVAPSGAPTPAPAMRAAQPAAPAAAPVSPAAPRPAVPVAPADGPLIGDASIGLRAAPPPRAEGAPAVQRAASMPAAPAPSIAPVAPTAPPPTAAPQAAPSASTAALLAAFLEGANAQALNVPGGLTPDMMRTMGRLVYHAVAGAMTLISARQITKREMGAEVTMIVPKGNNPLKFLPTPEAALMQILGPKMPGFMSSVDAMQDAFDDLRAHEVGVIAGTRAALSAVLRRFDPKALEERLGSGGLFDNLVPSTRRAKLWAAFETQFNEVYREAEDDFNKLFGEAFIQAYEAEVARHRTPR